MAGERTEESSASSGRASASEHHGDSASVDFDRIEILAQCERKLPAPEFRSGGVRRVRRLGTLAEIEASVVVISAPSGYGKTTLIAEWAELDARPFLYISLSDVATSATHLVVSLTRLSAKSRRLDSRPLAVAHSDDVQTLLTVVGSLFERCPEPVVLVIDDEHLVAGGDGEALVRALVDRVPSGSQLVLAARGSARFHLGHLRARHDVFELDAAKLALRDDECVALLSGSGLSPAAVAALAHRTEGWPAGLSLAMFELQAEPDPDVAALKFSGTDRFVADYMQDEFLDALSGETRDFLRRTSVLERLNAALCDAILDRGDSGQVLEDLTAASLMVFPLDRNGDWFRFHPLFREALAHDLCNRDAELFLALHLRASVWWQEAGNYDAAIRHAVHGGDKKRARDLIWEVFPTLVASNRGHEVEPWIDLLGRPALVEDPELALAVAGFTLADGNPGEVEWWISVAESELDISGVSDSAVKEGTREILHAFVANDGPHDMRGQAERASELIPPSNPMHFLARSFAAFATHLEGDRAAARVQWDALLQMSVVRMPQPEAVGEAFFALAAYDDKDWAEVETRTERSRSICRRHPWLDEKPGQALTFAVSGLCHARVGARSEAMRDWNHARTLLTRIGGFELWVPVLTRDALARASVLLGDLGAAYALNDEAVDLLDSSASWTSLLPSVAKVRHLIDRARNAELTRGERSLTPAEIRVLHLLPTHLSIGEVAAELLVSRNTVKSQTVSVYRKLDVSSRGEAVARARELNLIDSDPESDPPPAIDPGESVTPIG